MRRRRRFGPTTRAVAVLVGVGLASGGCSSARSSTFQNVARPSVARRCSGVPRGQVTTHHLSSAATDRSERFHIYQPPGATPNDRMGLLVLLHGGSADDTQWLDVGMASAADCMSGRGEIDKTLIVFVDGRAVERDHAKSPAPMERLVVDEILPRVRSLYPHLAGRTRTAIGGISLGGGWALRIAADNPELFSATGGHSPSVSLTDGERGSLGKHKVRVWIDAGRSDGVQVRAREEATDLRIAAAPVSFKQWNGGHDRRYWSQHTEDYLRFYDQSP